VQHVAALRAGWSHRRLYAGVGLFGLSACRRRSGGRPLVEGDPIRRPRSSGERGAFAGRARVERSSVEDFVARLSPGGDATLHRRPATNRDLERGARGNHQSETETLVYVSCDVATLARDSRTLLDAAYSHRRSNGFDLFPNTAHVRDGVYFSPS